MPPPVYATRAELANLGLSPKLLLAEGETPEEGDLRMSVEAQDAALSAASRTVDTYLRGRYRLPLTDWGDDLKRAVCHIAAWDLLSTLGFNPDNGADAAVRKRYDDAMRWLRDVASGNASPVVVDSSSGGISLAPRVASRPARGW